METHDDEETIKKMAGTIRKNVGELPLLSPKCCIYRVPHTLREANKFAYSPCLVSIGPFHHGKKKLQSMQEHKLRYLQNFLMRNKRKSLQDYLAPIRQWEEEIREYYVEKIDMSSREFDEMVLLDACFLLEFFLVWFFDQADENDCLFRNPSMEIAILRDILLLENQLPYFVLDGLYGIVVGDGDELVSSEEVEFEISESATDSDSDESSDGLRSLPSFISLCCRVLVGKGDVVEKFEDDQRVLHLVDFVRTCYLPTFLRDQSKDNGNNNNNNGGNDISDGMWEFPPGVERLHDAGIKFQVAKGESLLDVEFSNGVLWIPKLEVEDHTESLLLNLSAFEQCHYHQDSYIVDYVVLMDVLISSLKDVKILMTEGIVVNSLGNTEDLADVFNTICKGTVYNARGFYYARLCEELNAYYKTPWNKWRAKLKHEYFSNPWTIISVIAAVLLVILSVIQTICTVMSMP